MPCSRMPKCSVRPYGLPGHILVWRLTGRKDGSPSIVVRLDSARSAEPPHSSGSTGASAEGPCRTRAWWPCPSFVGGERPAARPPSPSGRPRAASRANSALRSGLAFSQAANCAVPLRVQRLAALGDLAGAAERLFLDGEVHGRVEAEDLLGRRDLGLAERGAVRGARCSAWSARASR